MNEGKALKLFGKQKIMTIDELTALLQVSTITTRRRLKKWHALTSINKNGRYYTLPDTPVFNGHGIWSCESVFFSKYGNLKQAITFLIQHSEAGLSAAEIAKIVSLSPNSSFFTQIKKTAGIVRKKYHGKFVYFSDHPERTLQQINNRITKPFSGSDMPTDADAILILVELLKSPGSSIEQLSAKIQTKGKNLVPSIILSFLQFHDLLKKISNTEH